MEIHMNIRKILICSGGNLGAWAIPYLQQPYNYFIGADKGALFLVENNIHPDLAIGDFDSVTDEQMMRITENSKNLLDFDAIDKDYTDTELAIHEALKLQADEILIVGGLGTRFDHSIANIQLLTLALEKNCKATIIDEYNKIQLINKRTIVQPDNYPYISLLPFTDEVNGITLEGFQYSLNEASIKKGQAIGVSNIIVEEQATIAVREGVLLVIQSKDNA